MRSGMMAARRGPVVPRIRLTAGLPLPGDPPSADFDRTGRIGEIEDHHDIADIAFDGRRDIGVTAVEIVAVHAAPGGAPLADRFRRARARDVIDSDAAAEVSRPVLADPLVVDDHEAVRHAHLVRMPALRQLDSGQHARMARIGHVDDGGAVRGLHVGDEQRRAVDPDLPAARAVDVRHEIGVGSTRHEALATMGLRRHGRSGRSPSAAPTVRRSSRRCRRRRDPTS
jgi:hypothetical protein